MNKKAIVIMIVALIVLTIGATFILSNYKLNNKTNGPQNINFIWDKVEEGKNLENDYWLRFRRTFEIGKNEKIKNVIAKISVDTRYWLYVNGEMVVREGSLKRSTAKMDISYDEVDLTNYLKEGKNTIAILVWHSGILSYSTTPFSQKGLYFEMPFGIVSDENWKVSRYNAYLHDSETPNTRLPEANILFDGNLAEEDWYLPEFDDSTWEKATYREKIGQNLVKRDIPLFKNLDLKEYENMEKYRNYQTVTDETIEMIMPYNAQFTPYLKVEAEAGKSIIIYTDTYDVNGVKSLRATYITRDGKQEFEALQWINGEKVYYCIPAGVKILSLGYRETGYDTKITGSFKCDDEFFNSLCEKSIRTLYVNMHDSYMDCPNRERAQWSLDMALAMEEAMYALDTNSYDLYKHGIRTIIGWREGKTLLTIAPNTLNPCQLPVQNLLLINSLYKYYEYTADAEFLKEVYPAIKDYLGLWEKNEFGILQLSSFDGLWEWRDSSEELDYKQLEYISYYLACQSAKSIAEVLKYDIDAIQFEQKLKDTKNTFDEFWTEKGYKSQDSDYVDTRINALAVISGVADESKYEIIANQMQGDFGCSPAMLKYVLEALCYMGKEDRALEIMKQKYDSMVEGENACSTLWEHWEYGFGSTNHAWSGSPIIIMSKYFAGISPLKPGYKETSIKPTLKTLNKISAKVTTIKGDISIEIEKNKNSMNMKIDTVSKTLVAIPKVFENQSIEINGKKLKKIEKEDEDYIYTYVSKGKFDIICKNK